MISRTNSFTLIELLIVVAIIGILAAIAVPNFLNARIRANIAKVQGDFNTIGAAVELYRIDHSSYPDVFANYDMMRDGRIFYFNSGLLEYSRKSYSRLTTPVAYLTLTFPLYDPFGKNISIDETAKISGWYSFFTFFHRVGREDFENRYNINVVSHETWVLRSLGPDVYSGGFPHNRLSKDSGLLDAYPVDSVLYLYDASNGLISNGDIHAFQGGAPSPYTYKIDGKPGPKTIH